MAQLLAAPFSYFTDANGAALAGGKVYTYVSGTTTPKASYTNSTGTVAAANPVILDSAGKAAIWLDGFYTIRVETSAGVLVKTTDNVSTSNSTASIPWAIAAGTADALAVTYNPVITTLTDGLQLAFRGASANTTTTPTFSPNGLTARTITKQGGSALSAGDIKASGEYLLAYNLANTRWELLTPATGGGMVLLSTQTASASASVDFTSVLSSTYKSYRLIGSNIVMSGDGNSIALQFNNGSVLTSGYAIEGIGKVPGGGVAAISGSSLSSIGLDYSFGSSNTDPSSFYINFARPDLSKLLHISWVYSGGYSTFRPVFLSADAWHATNTTPVTGIRILAPSGTITTGTFQLYGII